MKNQDRKNDSPASTFKAGAVSLAFLIIGYQTALFVQKAAKLRIEANRDKPDTVFVYVRDGVEKAESEVALPDIPLEARGKVGKNPSRRDTITVRKEAPHSPAVREYRARTRRVESFPFNPNTATAEDFRRLGFSEKQAASLCAYREKGGHFSRKADFARSYVVSDSLYARLESFIVIPKLNINTADSAQFDALPGIGGYYAAKMVEYRRKIGRFSSIEQLMDIRGFDRERFDGLSDLVTCGDDE